MASKIAETSEAIYLLMEVGQTGKKPWTVEVQACPHPNYLGIKVARQGQGV